MFRQRIATTTVATPTWAPWWAVSVPRAVLAMSSRWLMTCSMPEDGEVCPATPIEMPDRVTNLASVDKDSGSEVPTPGARPRSSAPWRRVMVAASAE